MTSASEEAGEESSEPPTDEDSHDVEGMEEMAQGDEAIGETMLSLAKGVGAAEEAEAEAGADAEAGSTSAAEAAAAVEAEAEAAAEAGQSEPLNATTSSGGDGESVAAAPSEVGHTWGFTAAAACPRWGHHLYVNILWSVGRSVSQSVGRSAGPSVDGSVSGRSVRSVGGCVDTKSRSAFDTFLKSAIASKTSFLSCPETFWRDESATVYDFKISAPKGAGVERLHGIAWQKWIDSIPAQARIIPKDLPF